MLNKLNLSILLPLLLISLSLVYSTKTIDPVLMPRMVVLSLGLLIFTVLMYFNRQYKVKGVLSFLQSKNSWPFYLYILSSSVSVFNANTLSEAYYSLGATVLFLLLMLLTLAICIDNKKGIESIFKGIIAITFIFTLSGLEQVLNLDFITGDTYNVKSLLGHRNLFASALVLGFFFSCYGVIYFKKGWRIFSLVVLLISLFSVVFLEARSAMLALFSGILSFIVISVFQKQNWNVFASVKGKYALWFGALVIVVFTTIYVSHKIEPIKRFEIGKSLASESQGDYTVKERSLLWESTVFMALDAGYLGVGAGNWKIEFPKYGSGIWRARQGMVQFQRPHNDFLWVLSESGIIGFTGYLLMFIVIVKMCWTLLFRQTLDKNEKLIIRLILSMLMAYIVVASFSFPKERVIHQTILFMSFGIVLSLYYKDSKTLVLSKNWLVIAAFILLPILIMSLERTKGETLSKDLMRARSNNDWNFILSELDNGNKLHFYANCIL